MQCEVSNQSKIHSSLNSGLKKSNHQSGIDLVNSFHNDLVFSRENVNVVCLFELTNVWNMCPTYETAFLPALWAIFIRIVECHPRRYGIYAQGALEQFVDSVFNIDLENINTFARKYHSINICRYCTIWRPKHRKQSW